MRLVSKSKNLRWIVCLLAFLLSACDRSDHYRKGMDWMAKKDYTRAHLEFLKAIKKNQGTVETYYEAGVSAMELNANSDANRFLAVADNLAGPKSPIDVDIKARLATLALLRRDFKDARDIAKWVLDRYPKNAKAHEILVLALTGLAQPEMAAQEMDVWLTEDPTSQRARMIRSAVSLSKEDLPEAIKQLEDAAAQPSKTAQTLISLGNLYQISGQYEKAEQAYRQAAGMDPNNVEPLKGLAWMYARLGKTDKSVEIFRKLAEMKPDDPVVRGSLAGYYLNQHLWPQAIAELERLRKLYPKDTYNRARLAGAYMLSGQRAKAGELVKVLMDEDSSNPQNTLLAGILEFQEGQVDKAIVHLSNSMEYRPSAMAQYFIGAAQDRKGDLQLAQVAMTRALRLDPNMIAARLWLAEYWLQQSAPSTALSVLLQDPQAKNPSVMEQLLLTRVYSAMGNYDMANKELAEVRKQHPEVVPAYYENALKFLIKHQWSQARPALEDGLEHEPASINFLAVLAQSYIAEGHPDKAVERVRKQVERFPKSSMHFQLLAETEEAARDFGAARVAYERAIALSPESPGPVLGLVGTLVMSGRNEDARAKINELTRHWPQWSQSWILYGGFMENQADYPEATTGYEKAVALDPANSLALNNLAWRIYSDGGNMDRALQLAQKAHDLQPENAAYADTLAMIYLRVGSRPQAERVMLAALKLQPGNPVFQQHLAAIQGKRR
jgi:tetratricopeptide (TPR) repeat protein